MIVSGISPNTTDDALDYFFANKKRSGGETGSTIVRVEPRIAHITFINGEGIKLILYLISVALYIQLYIFFTIVASRVLSKENLKLDEQLLHLKAQKSELILPLDQSKIYIENLNQERKTTKDTLVNYIELLAGGLDVTDLQFGNNNNALVTLSGQPGEIRLTIYDYYTSTGC